MYIKNSSEKFADRFEAWEQGWGTRAVGKSGKIPQIRLLSVLPVRAFDIAGFSTRARMCPHLSLSAAAGRFVLLLLLSLVAAHGAHALKAGAASGILGSGLARGGRAGACFVPLPAAGLGRRWLQSRSCNYAAPHQPRLGACSTLRMASTPLGHGDKTKMNTPADGWDFENIPFQTPLWMITQEPDLNNLVMYLQTLKDEIMENPDTPRRVKFSRAQVEAARTAFSRMVRRGEMRLHRLCELTGDDIFDRNYARQSVVIGQRGSVGQGQRFQLTQPLSSDELYALTDLDLGSRQLERFKWQQEDSWVRATLVANFVEYEALEVNKWGVFKCTSRIKAEEEIWNKVVDEIFDIDNLVKREKELRHLSRFVKDVFGLKLVVGDEEQARRVQRHLQDLEFSDEALLAHGVPVLDSTRKVSVIEVKDYLTETASQTKTSGWRALKSVVMWWDTPIEIQLQVLRNYHRERERITKESHSEFKARREELRDLIAGSIPLFGFYRDLLQWLFRTTASDVDAPPPTFNNVYVELVD